MTVPAGTDSDGDVGEPQIEETVDRMVNLNTQNAGHSAQIILTNGKYPSVEVLTLHLNHAEVPREHVALGSGKFVQVGEVDGDTGPAGLLGEVYHAGFDANLGGSRKKLVNRHLVELGKSLKAGNRNGTLATLVGAEHRRLELL